MQIIVFTLGDKLYALNTENVEEISTDSTATFIPKAPAWVEGLINLRGNVIPLLNMFKLLDQGGNLCYNNIIIVEHEDSHMGLMVSDVIKVVDISEEDIHEVRDSNYGLTGLILLDGKIVNQINLDKLLSGK